MVKKEEVPPEWNPSMEQQVPESMHIKGEEEELCISQEGEQLNVLEEADITRFLFTAVTVKSESDEEDPQFSQLHQSQTEDREAEPSAVSSTAQIKTETDGEDCERSKPAGNLGMSHQIHLSDNVSPLTQRAKNLYKILLFEEILLLYCYWLLVTSNVITK